MKVGFNNLGFDQLPEAKRYRDSGIAGLVQATADFGFKGFQLTTSGPQRPEYFREIDVAGIGRQCAELGVKISVHHHAFDLLSYPHFLVRDSYVDEYRDYLKAAGEFLREVNGHLVTFHPPQINVRYFGKEDFIDAASRRKAIAAFRDMIKELGDFAAAQGIRYGIEAICFGDPFPGGTAFRSPDEFDEFLNTPDFPATVGILLDTGHFHYTGLGLIKHLRRWPDKLWDIHTSDSVIHKWVDFENRRKLGNSEFHLPIGKGSVDFKAVVQTLKEAGYQGWFTLELYPQNVDGIDDHLLSRQKLEALIAAD